MRRLSMLAVLVALVPLLVVQTPASAEVTEFGWPYPPTNIDPYSPRIAPVCDFTVKPGPLRLKEFLSFWYPGLPTQFNPDWHIRRPCAQAEPSSYHREGRALDFYVNASDPRAQSIVNFMLADDEYVNHHARARRWGIIEIIWKNDIWSSDRASEGFRPCGSCGGHFDHIHFSFSHAGANKQTSWHTTLDRTATKQCGDRTVTVKFWRYPSGYGPLKHIRSITGWGSYTTQTALHNSPWRVYTALGPANLFADSPVSAAYTARAWRGDCIINLRDNT